MAKSLRLTNEMRKSIVDSVMNKWANTHKKPQLVEAEDAFANAIWDKAYGAHKVALNKVPKEFLQNAHIVKLTVDGEMIQVSSKTPLPTKQIGYNPPPIIMIKSSLPIYIKYHKVEQDYEEWGRSYSEMVREVEAVLESVNTTGQLLEAWPSVEPFLPAHIADPEKGVKLPAIQVSRLNERIGIK